MGTVPTLVQHLPVRQIKMPEDALNINRLSSKFFTFVISINLTGLILAIFNIWTYPRNYTGAFVLGNLLFAILMRNELFGRFLYLFVNTLFAKVCPFFPIACATLIG